MRLDIYEVQDRNSITLPMVFNDAVRIMKRSYDFTPTIIELHHLKGYAQMALNNWKSSPDDDYFSWEYSSPTSDSIQLFFMDLYGYDMKHERRNMSEDGKWIKELLRRKQEQAHMMIDFSTNLESRSNS